jgi:hypothetical protein
MEAPANKQMNLIRHDYIPPEGNSAQLTVSSETNQRVMHMSISQKLLALMRVERHKVQRRIVALEHLMQSRRSISHGQTDVVEALVPSA